MEEEAPLASVKREISSMVALLNAETVADANQ